MPHLRNRLILHPVQKLLRFWPVISLLGPRQCGKSTFLRDLLFKSTHSFDWVTLDKKADRKLANDNPELFLNRFEKSTLVIDEAHKAPELFDEIKSKVDEKRIPGAFILSGSVNFSRNIGIQESLTGRSALIRMDTMTIPETLSKKDYTLKEMDFYLKKGGMPGVCFTRNEETSQDYWEQWIETTCHRDLQIFSKGKLSGDLAEEVLAQSAKLPLPQIAEIAKTIGVDARRVKTHIEALTELFILRKIEAAGTGIGKAIYLPFDTGLAMHFGASLKRRWQTGFLVHYFNQSQFMSQKAKPVKYYLTSRHSFIDFEIGLNEFHLFCDKPNPGRSELMTIKAAKKANPNHTIYVHCATDSFQELKHEHSRWLGWVYGWQMLFTKTKIKTGHA